MPAARTESTALRFASRFIRTTRTAPTVSARTSLMTVPPTRSARPPQVPPSLRAAHRLRRRVASVQATPRPCCARSGAVAHPRRRTLVEERVGALLDVLTEVERHQKE